jgi:hypothetical protein
MAVSRRTKCSRVKGVLPPRRQVFNAAGPNSFGTYMKLAPFSRKYYLPQCIFIAGISAVHEARPSNTPPCTAASTARGIGSVNPMNVFIRHRWKVSKRLAAFRFTPISRHCELVVLNLLCDWPAGKWHRGPMAQVMNDDIEADVTLLGEALSGAFIPCRLSFRTTQCSGTLKPGQHGSTFGGNPLACAVVRAALRLLVDEGTQVQPRCRNAWAKNPTASIKIAPAAEPVSTWIAGGSTVLGVAMRNPTGPPVACHRLPDMMEGAV